VLQLARRGEDLETVHLMGFRQWESLDRRVRKGEKAVWILAPMTRKIRDTDDDGRTSDRVVVTGFKSVPVFNISQTDGTPLPDAPVRPVRGGATPGTLEGLRDRVAGAGYAFEETAIPGCQPDTGQGTLGYTDPQSKRIVVDERLSPAQKASTIAHELGHVHCGHVDGDFQDYRRHRGRMETEAEMTAYMVNRARGMDRSGAEAFSPGYIATWSRGDAAVVTTAMDKATKAFNTIMAGAWPASS
jgi:antirestriction protein ArdC